MDVVIRNMRISDGEMISKVDLITLGETLGEQTILDHIQNNSLMNYFVMETKTDKLFVGQVSLWIDEDKAQINNFYIVKTYQGQKLGKTFMNYIMEYFHSIGIHEITLEVRKSNLVAIKLYESFGFKTVTTRENYYPNGESALMMYLKIGSD